MQVPWKQILPLKSVSIKKWFKEIKMKKKEGQRLQRAEVHAAISIAGVAAALAAIAAENSKKESNQDRDAAVASAAALVAAQCAKVAEAMGAKKEQLSSVIGSAMSGTSASDILTLTAAAATCNFLILNFISFNFFKCFYVIWRGERVQMKDLATDFGTKNLVSVVAKVLKFLSQSEIRWSLTCPSPIRKGTFLLF